MHGSFSISKLLKQLLFGFVRINVAEGEGGGADDGAAAMQAKIDEAVNAAVGGLKSKNSELLGSLKAAKDSLANFDGIDPTVVRGILAKFASDEEAGLIAAGKIDEVLSQRTERMQVDFQRQLKAAQDETGKHLEANKKLAGRALSEAILKAAAKAGAEPTAYEDIVLRARGGGWSVNADGDVVAMNGDEVVLGKDGKTPLSPIEWAESLRETAPHLWPRASGTNANPSSNFKGGADLSKLSPTERLTAARAGK